MAAEVSMQIKSESKDKLITRDFLGGCFDINDDSKELNLDMHVPSGWEKHLDLKSGKVYIQKCNPINSLSQSSSKLSSTLKVKEDASLDLKLLPNCSPSNNTSVCTLEKVKSALDRVAERASTSSSSSSSKRRWIASSTSPDKSSTSSSSMSYTSFVKERDDDEIEASQKGCLVATACSNCFLYVLISKSDPKCPQCNSVIQFNMVAKKPKIDLNMSL